MIWLRALGMIDKDDLSILRSFSHLRICFDVGHTKTGGIQIWSSKVNKTWSFWSTLATAAHYILLFALVCCARVPKAVKSPDWSNVMELTQQQCLFIPQVLQCTRSLGERLLTDGVTTVSFGEEHEYRLFTWWDTSGSIRESSALHGKPKVAENAAFSSLRGWQWTPAGPSQNNDSSLAQIGLHTAASLSSMGLLLNEVVALKDVIALWTDLFLEKIPNILNLNSC